jgi:hypothetical protein
MTRDGRDSITSMYSAAATSQHDQNPASVHLHNVTNAIPCIKTLKHSGAIGVGGGGDGMTFAMGKSAFDAIDACLY